MAQVLSFAEAEAQTERLAAALYAAGVRKDDVVVVQWPNIVEIVIAFLACARLGAIASPVMLAYGERDLRRIVRHLRPSAFLTLSRWRDAEPVAVAARLATEAAAGLFPVFALGDVAQETVHAAAGAKRGTQTRTGSDTGRIIRFARIQDLPGDVAALRAYLATVTIHADEIVTMHWTSGTTGDPKCVPRSHNQWHGTGHACTDAGMLERHDRILAPMQMVHTAGYSGMFMPWLEVQGMLVMHQPFDMEVYLGQIEHWGIHHTVAAPAMLNALLRNGTLEGRRLGTLRSILCGSAPLDPWMIEGFKQRHGIEVVNAFGSTEGMTFTTGPAISADPYRRARYFPRFRGAATDDGGRDLGYRIASVLETKLVDPDSGLEIDAPRRPGELLFRSPALFPGYWTPEHTLDRRDFDAEGYFRCGELFEIAGEGDDARFYHYVDRLKDVINRGGLKIPAGELEAVIQEHPAVAEAVAIGYPDPQLGERICAVVALRPGASLSLDGLLAHVEERGLARFMWPERLEVVVALPRNATGKVLKRELMAGFQDRA
jgi:acyl-CoA synthetase (AMP-forming)/AMP-acid ligase II